MSVCCECDYARHFLPRLSNGIKSIERMQDGATVQQ